MDQELAVFLTNFALAFYFIGLLYQRNKKYGLILILFGIGFLFDLSGTIVSIYVNGASILKVSKIIAIFSMFILVLVGIGGQYVFNNGLKVWFRSLISPFFILWLVIFLKENLSL